MQVVNGFDFASMWSVEKVARFLLAHHSQKQCRTKTNAMMNLSCGLLAVPSNISIPPTSVNEKLGLRVTFHCTVRGFPRPTLLWTKDNIILDVSNETEIAQQEDSGKIETFTSLTIVQAKRSDTGVYVCQANNSAGTTSKAANLTVLGKYPFYTTSCNPVA